MKLLGVKKLRTTGYNAKANGLCEKLNGVVKQYLLKYTNFVGKEWDQWMREACHAYNSSVNSSTGFTPAELMFGRNLRVPMDIIDGLSINEQRLFSMKEFRDKLSKMYEIASEHVNTRQIKSNTYHDAKVKDDQLEVNTLVYIYLPRKQRMKLELKWEGPYRILNEKHPVYEIEVSKTKTKWLTRDKLRKCEKGAFYSKMDDEIIDNIVENNNDNDSVNESESDDSDDNEDSDYEQNVNVEDAPRQNNRYEFRRNIAVPQRYGNYVMHYANVLF